MVSAPGALSAAVPYARPVQDPPAGRPWYAACAPTAGRCWCPRVIRTAVPRSTDRRRGGVCHLLRGGGGLVLLEGSAQGAALGKRALGLRVIDANTGGPIGRGRALVRQLGKSVSAAAVGLGYLWVLWDPRRQAWHDKFANDVVVTVK